MKTYSCFLIKIVLLFLGCFLLLGNVYAQKGSAEDVYKKVSSSVVTVFTYNQSGKVLGQASGVVIDNSGGIVTNFHILNVDDLVDKIEIRHLTETYEVIGTLGADIENDLLMLDTKATQLSPVKKSNSEELTVGQKIFAIGSPAGFENSISEGILSGIRKEGKYKRLQITAPVSPGSSGGAAVNAKGELAGICNMIVGNAQNINLAIPVNDVLKLQASAKKISNNNLSSLFMVAGDYFLLINNSDRAISYYIKAKTISENPVTLNKLANACYAAKKYQSAQRFSSQAIAMNDALPESYFILGMVYLKKSKSDSAVWCANKILQLDSLNPDGWLLKAEAAFAKEKYTEAISFANKASSNGTNTIRLYNVLGKSLLRAGKRSEAIDYARKSISLNGTDDEIWLLLSHASYDLKYYDEAYDAALKAMELNPRSEVACVQAALSAEKLQRYREAKMAALKAIQLEPGDILGYSAMGVISFSMKNYTDAINYNKIAIQMDSSYQRGYEIICASYLHTAMKDSADYFYALKKIHENDKENFYTKKRKNKNSKSIELTNIEKNECTIRVGANFYNNMQFIVTYREQPVLTFKGWKNNFPDEFNLEVYDMRGRKAASIVNSKFVSGDSDYVQIITTPDECICIDKATQIVLFHAKKTDENNTCQILLWLNLYLPDGTNLQATPEQSSAFNSIGNDNTFTNGFSVFPME